MGKVILVGGSLEVQLLAARLRREIPATTIETIITPETITTPEPPPVIDFRKEVETNPRKERKPWDTKRKRRH